jgi:hypothetical protein
MCVSGLASGAADEEDACMFLFLACTPPDPSAFGGQSGNEGASDPYCEEVSREDLAPDALPEGFVSTPAEVLAATTGSWSGWFDHDAGALTDGAMTLSAAGDAELVTEVLVTMEDVDTGAREVRVSSDECPTRYEIPASATLYGDLGFFDEAFALTLVAPALTEPRFAVALPLDEVGGTARPSWDTTAWEATELLLEGYVTEQADTTYFVVSAAWRSLRYPDEHSVEQEAEDVGGFALER